MDLTKNIVVKLVEIRPIVNTPTTALICPDFAAAARRLLTTKLTKKHNLRSSVIQSRLKELPIVGKQYKRIDKRGRTTGVNAVKKAPILFL
ncbi:unnamed protein product [Cercopithifilaria johnstoni]|uniref:Uncharacterized protein n=1 Tax=Cercopithifilaria johnstoni TaxID=2874296 RepID=A0A8J2LVV4_9BILA|nr:unnamed protein product [Cercopithifilaria johnstoni]